MTAPAPPDLAPPRVFAKWTKRGNGTVSTPFASGYVSDVSAEYVRADIAASELSAAVAATQQCMERLEQARVVIQPFADIAAEMFARNWERDDTALSFHGPDGVVRLTFADFLAARDFVVAFLAKPEGQP